MTTSAPRKVLKRARWRQSPGQARNHGRIQHTPIYFADYLLVVRIAREFND
jgi:hypothetical protein